MAKYDELVRTEGLLHKIEPEKLAELQGEILTLFMQSKRHQVTTVSDFSNLVLPAVHFNQFRLYRHAGRPIGWICWAFMSDQDAEGFMNGGFRFGIETWRSGENLWFIDIVAPFGHAKQMITDLKTNVFPNRVGYAPELAAHNSRKRVRKFVGAEFQNDNTSIAEDAFVEAVSA